MGAGNGNRTPIALVALDLDGTLLQRDGRVPARNAAAIAAALAQGVQVILATGKTRFSALGVIDELALDGPGVFSQGLIIYDGAGTILREVTLDRGLAEEVLGYAEREGLPHSIYTREGLFAPQADKYRELISSKYGERLPQVVGPLTECLDVLDVNKILIGDPAEDGSRRQMLVERFGSRLTVTQAVPEYVELFAPQASKGAGLLWLLRHLGVDAQAVLAVGDGDNDLEMLELAGVGVAVGNARPGVKAAADFVVSDHEDGGVAEALERFVLRKE